MLIEPIGEDGLDRVVAVLAHGMRARTRGLQTRGAKALGEAEDALGAAQAIEGTIVEQRLDERGAGGPDLGGALATPGGRLQEEVDFVGRQMVDERAPLTGARATVGGDEGIVMKELDLPGGGAHPQALADEPMGRRVVGPGEDDVAIGVELGFLPLEWCP